MSTKPPSTSKSARPEPAKSDPLYISSVERAMNVLRAVADAGRPMPVSDIARAAGVTQSNAWRLCYTLQKLGYMTSDSSGLFRPALPLLSLGYSALAADSVEALSAPLMTGLATRFGGIAGIAIRDGTSMMFVRRWDDSRSTVTMRALPGALLPIITTALGWAQLASMGGPERKELLKKIKANQPEQYAAAQPALDKEIARYERDGFVINEGIFYSDVCFTATTVQHRAHGVVYSLVCGGLTSSFSRALLEQEVGPALRKVAIELQLALDALPR